MNRFVAYFLNRRLKQLQKNRELYGTALALAILRRDGRNQTYFAYHLARIERQLKETKRFADGKV